MSTCEMSERSARGYCPDEEQDAMAEHCSVNPETSFCAGPSDVGHEDLELVARCANPDDFTIECYEWRLETYGDGYWGTNEGWHPTECPSDVDCDDSFTDVCTDQGLTFDYATGGCAPLDGEASTVAYDAQTLPDAGPVMLPSLLGAGLAFGVIGTWMLRCLRACHA